MDKQTWTDLVDVGSSLPQLLCPPRGRQTRSAIPGDKSLETRCYQRRPHPSQSICPLRGTKKKWLTFFQQDTLEQRVFIAQHQALVGSRTMTLLQRAKSIFVLLDRRLKLLDVLGPAFSERSLSLPIPLLAFLGRCVDLKND